MDSATLTAVGLILLALLAGVLSPGPSFVMCARTAVTKSKLEAISLCFGLALGATSIAALCLAGLHALLTAVPWLYAAFKVVGGLYLLYLAWSIFKGANQPLVVEAATGSATAARNRLVASFALGLWTQCSNPKAAVVYGGVFAAFLPAGFSLMGAALVCAGVFVMEFGWMAFVAMVLSSNAPRQAYLRFKAAIDRAAAGVMGLLGIRLVAAAAD